MPFQMAAVHEETERGGSIRRLPPAGAAALQPTPTQEDTPEATPTGGTPTGGETTSIESPRNPTPTERYRYDLGKFCLINPPPPGTVKALVCLACQHPNPPATGHCGGCDQTLADPPQRDPLRTAARTRCDPALGRPHRDSRCRSADRPEPGARGLSKRTSALSFIAKATAR